MNEPRREEIAADADQPATKGYVKEQIDQVAQATERGFATTATKQDLTAITGRLDGVEVRIDQVETRLDGVEERLERVEKTTGRILDVVNSIDAKLDGLPEWVEQVEMDSVSSRMTYRRQCIIGRRRRTLAGIGWRSHP